MVQNPLLAQLADGQFHSGEDLAALLGVSRTAVWKQLNKLESLNLQIESVKGRGYRIPGGIDFIDREQVLAGLSPQGTTLLRELEVFDVIDSTNLEALRRLQQDAGATGLVCCAEQQTAGRGRRGRPWVSPYARNLYFSLTWGFERGAVALEGLSLAVGVAVVRGLQALGVEGVSLKWPNDVLYGGAKLGGVLLEMVGDATGACQVVIGVGINVAMPPEAADGIDQDWTDLASITGDSLPGRSALLAALLDELLPLLDGFEAGGFALWREAWTRLDAHAGKTVVMTSGGHQVAGISRGVDDRGALQLETSVGIQSIFGGEISLRADP